MLAFLFAPIVWKLAQRTLFFADFEGLRELLSTRVAPGGLLDWVSRGCQVMGLGACAWLLYGLVAAGTISLWWCVFARERKGLGIVLAFPAVLLPLFPRFSRVRSCGFWTTLRPVSVTRSACGWRSGSMQVLDASREEERRSWRLSSFRGSEFIRFWARWQQACGAGRSLRFPRSFRCFTMMTCPLRPSISERGGQGTVPTRTHRRNLFHNMCLNF